MLSRSEHEELQQSFPSLANADDLDPSSTASVVAAEDEAEEKSRVTKERASRSGGSSSGTTGDKGRPTPRKPAASMKKEQDDDL